MNKEKAGIALDKAYQKDPSMIKRLHNRIVNNLPSVVRVKTNEIWKKMNEMRKQSKV
jgi:hypothetical protein